MITGLARAALPRLFVIPFSQRLRAEAGGE